MYCTLIAVVIGCILIYLFEIPKEMCTFVDVVLLAQLTNRK